MIILISLAAFVFTMLGGLFALKFKDKLHLILGFSAGAVIGVAFFELIPEAIKLGGGSATAGGAGSFDTSTIMTVTAIGFIIYMLLDRFIILHSHHDDAENHSHSHGNRGKLGALSLSIHSFLDGIAIGLAFQVSSTIGLIVTFAVLAHDFSDGINTVNMILKNQGKSNNDNKNENDAKKTHTQAIKWLLIDAVAPVLGIISTLFFSLPQSTLGIILALFAGFFLYIGASDLLPESHHSHPTIWTTLLTVLGMIVIYGAVNLAGI